MIRLLIAFGAVGVSIILKRAWSADTDGLKTVFLRDLITQKKMCSRSYEECV